MLIFWGKAFMNLFLNIPGHEEDYFVRLRKRLLPYPSCKSKQIIIFSFSTIHFNFVSF